jgi:hypothetical protein
MSDNSQNLTIDAVADWSKWITGLSMFSVSGCVSILLTKGVGHANIINIKFAVAFFILTVLSSWFIQIFAAELKQHTPERLDAVAEIKIFSYPAAKRGFRILIFTEMVFFLLSLLFLFLWIWNLPSKVFTTV